MKFIADTNILFSYFWKNSITVSLIRNPNLKLISPEYALKEIEKYKQDIIKKTNISETTFNALKYELKLHIKFVPIKEYKEKLNKARKISPDPDDVDFFALAIKTKSPIWSNDKQLKKQEKILVISTDELLNIEEFRILLSKKSKKI